MNIRQRKIIHKENEEMIMNKRDINNIVVQYLICEEICVYLETSNVP